MCVCARCLFPFFSCFSCSLLRLVCCPCHAAVPLVFISSASMSSFCFFCRCVAGFVSVMVGTGTAPVAVARCCRCHSQCWGSLQKPAHIHAHTCTHTQTQGGSHRATATLPGLSCSDLNHKTLHKLAAEDHKEAANVAQLDYYQAGATLPSQGCQCTMCQPFAPGQTLIPHTHTHTHMRVHTKKNPAGCKKIHQQQQQHRCA